MVSPSAGASELKYRDINTETSSPGEAKGLKKQEEKLNILSYRTIDKNRMSFIKSNNIELTPNKTYICFIKAYKKDNNFYYYQKNNIKNYIEELSMISQKIFFYY